MKSKINTRYLLLGAIVLFIVIAATSNYSPEVSGSLTYAREKGSVCVDTDGGKDYYAAGAADGLSDWCESSKILIEYSCDPYGLVSRERYTCTGDYSCSNGACVIGVDICVDTDGGRLYSYAGTVTVAGKSYKDSCYSSTAVKEFYCSPINEKGESIQDCARGCIEDADGGHCVLPS